jgi:nicotinate-nucleotide adenylyltransferase
MIRDRLKNRRSTTLVFGGMFDPPTKAHARLPISAFRKLPHHEKNELLYLPGVSPHYKNDTRTSFHHRLHMLRFACDAGTTQEEEGQMRISYLGEDAPAPMIEIVRKLNKIDLNRNLAFLIGADQAAALDTWVEWEELVKLAEPVMMARPGVEVKDWKFSSVEVWKMDISSTRIRQLIAERQFDHPDLLDYVNPGVLDYIRRHNLYSETDKEDKLQSSIL